MALHDSALRWSGVGVCSRLTGVVSSLQLTLKSAENAQKNSLSEEPELLIWFFWDVTSFYFALSPAQLRS